MVPTACIFRGDGDELVCSVLRRSRTRKKLIVVYARRWRITFTKGERMLSFTVHTGPKEKRLGYLQNISENTGRVQKIRVTPMRSFGRVLAVDGMKLLRVFSLLGGRLGDRSESRDILTRNGQARGCMGRRNELSDLLLGEV